jgi:hypothetical protein
MFVNPRDLNQAISAAACCATPNCSYTPVPASGVCHKFIFSRQDAKTQSFGKFFVKTPSRLWPWREDIRPGHWRPPSFGHRNG